MDMMNQIRSNLAAANPARLLDFFQDFNFTNINDLRNLSGLILGAVVTGIATVVIYAQFFDNRKIAARVVNAAIGDASKVVHRPGDPPIPPPTEIVSLRIYPIKSCRGFEVDATRLRKTGLLLDRNWMFISKSDRNFMTIRSNPSMTLIDTAVITEAGEQMLEVSVHGTTGRVVIPAFPSKEWLEANTKLSTVEIWEEKTDAWEYGDDINKIFSDFFNQKVALVYKGPQARNININGREDLYGK
ncbi:hypothetical protein LTR95_016480, partial [Oleoguttula sp. CCFEE 5521]